MARRLKKWGTSFSLNRTLYALVPLGGLVLLIICFLWIGRPSIMTKGPIKSGVTFSIPYARDLGLNWREALRAILDDLGVRHFRIPVYWSTVEPKRNEFDWSDIDYQMDEISMRNGDVILAVGAKLPRWPECWIPEWAIRQSERSEQQDRLDYIRAAVERYKDHPALAAWQVENEALFPFGICPKPSRAFLKQEIELVRKLDITHPITTTDSGELSTWLLAGSLPDRLGVSTYRTVLTFWGGSWEYWWIPPYWYARHATLLKPFVKDVYVSEFQMEPWAEDALTVTPLREQFDRFSIDQMRDNFSYAERMRINEIYFWGAEWWWWLKTTQGDDRYWEEAKAFFQKYANE